MSAKAVAESSARNLKSMRLAEEGVASSSAGGWVRASRLSI